MDINFHQLEQMANNRAPKSILIELVCLEFQQAFNFNLVDVYIPTQNKENKQNNKKESNLNSNLISLCNKAIQHDQSLLTTDQENNCILITPFYPRHLKQGTFIFFKANADTLIDRTQMESLVKRFSSILQKPNDQH